LRDRNIPQALQETVSYILGQLGTGSKFSEILRNSVGVFSRNGVIYQKKRNFKNTAPRTLKFAALILLNLPRAS
jgi:hypothetical protein